MLNDHQTLRPDGPVREALRSLREASPPGAAPPPDPGDRGLLWQRRLAEFVASAPELALERDREALD